MNNFALAISTTCIFSCVAAAEYAGVTVGITENINNTGLTQYRFTAHFDGEGDKIWGWGAYAAHPRSLIIATNAPQGFNQAPSNLDPIWGWDVANAYAFMMPEGAIDTWLGIGDAGYPDAHLLDGVGGHVGAFASVESNQASVGMTPDMFIGPGELVIANLVVEDGYGVELAGAVHWADDPYNLEFGVFHFNNIPAPGALALFGLAGVAITRRRR